MVNNLSLVSIVLAACLVTGAPIQNGGKTSIQVFRDFAILAKRSSGDIGQAVGDIVNAGIGLGSSHSDVKRNQHPDDKNQFVTLAKHDVRSLIGVGVDVTDILDDAVVTVLSTKRNQHPDGEDQFVALTKRGGENLDDVLVDVDAMVNDITVDVLKAKRNQHPDGEDQFIN